LIEWRLSEHIHSIEGLSDHDAQILSLPDTSIPNNGNELYTC